MDKGLALPARGAVEGSGQLDNGRLWLNTAGVVDRIIRDFTADVLQLVGRDDFESQLDFRTRALNNLFLSITPDDRYQTGPWNSPDQLGEFALKALQIDGETRFAVRDAFMVYLATLLELADPEQEFTPSVLDPLIANLRNVLLGLDDASPFYAIPS